MSEPKLSPSVKSKLKKWRNNLKLSKGFKEVDTTRTATDLHVRLAKYPEVALTLHYICNVYREDWKHYKHIFVGEALAEYFERHLGLSPEEFEKLIKPAPTLEQLEKMVKGYCKIGKRELNKEILAVIYYDWEKERDIVHRVRVFLENTFKGGYTDIVKYELEKIRGLQAKIHYGLFGDILDLYSDFSREWFTRKLHDKKFRRKLDNLTKILSKAEKVITDIQQSKETYLK